MAVAEKFESPAVDEDQSEKRARTGQGEDVSFVSDFAKEREAAIARMDRSGSPAVQAGERVGGVVGKDVEPVRTQPVPDPLANSVPYVEPPVRPGFIPDGLTEDDVRQGVTHETKEAQAKAAKEEAKAAKAEAAKAARAEKKAEAAEKK